MGSLCHCGHKGWAGHMARASLTGPAHRKVQKAILAQSGCRAFQVSSGTLHIPRRAQIPGLPPACLIRGFTAPSLRPEPPWCGPWWGGQGTPCGVQCLPRHLSSWALAGQGGCNLEEQLVGEERPEGQPLPQRPHGPCTRRNSSMFVESSSHALPEPPCRLGPSLSHSALGNKPRTHLLQSRWN